MDKGKTPMEKKDKQFEANSRSEGKSPRMVSAVSSNTIHSLIIHIYNYVNFARHFISFIFVEQVIP